MFLHDDKMQHSRNNICNMSCEKVFLETSASYEESNIRVTSIVTNISGQDIKSPLILVSSLLGNKVLTSKGIQAGETQKITQTYNVTTSDFLDSFVSNVSFIAKGVMTPEGKYKPGERMSPVKSEKIANDFIVVVRAIINPIDSSYNVKVLIDVTNVKPSQVTELIIYTREISANANVELESGGDYFIIDKDKNLTLKSGVNLEFGVTYKASINILLNPVCQTGANCWMKYFSKNTTHQNTKKVNVRTLS